MDLRIKIIVSFACAFSLAGCGAVMNPYKGEFACPDYDKGQCIQVEGAYKESLRSTRQPAPDQAVQENCKDCKGEGAKNVPVSGQDAAPGETQYQRAVNEKMVGMLREPKTPLMVPPKVMRVLVLPYRGDANELYMMRYVYIMVDEPKWVMGKYLMEKDEE